MYEFNDDNDDDEASIATLAATLSAHPSAPQLLSLFRAALNAATLDAVVGVAMEQCIGALCLRDRQLGGTSMPALGRLLEHGALVSLELRNLPSEVMFLNSRLAQALPPSPTFCAALIASRLQRLELYCVRLFDDLDSGLALLAAATCHLTLHHVGLLSNPVAEAHRPAIGAALGALVGAKRRRSPRSS